MLNGTFSSWKETVKIIDSSSYFLRKRKQFSAVKDQCTSTAKPLFSLLWTAFLPPRSAYQLFNLSASKPFRSAFLIFHLWNQLFNILALQVFNTLIITITTASTHCVVQNFQLICNSQQVNAMSKYNDSASSRCSKWPNVRMVARKKRLQRRMTKNYHSKGVQENIGEFSKS